MVLASPFELTVLEVPYVETLKLDGVWCPATIVDTGLLTNHNQRFRDNLGPARLVHAHAEKVATT